MRVESTLGVNHAVDQIWIKAVMGARRVDEVAQTLGRKRGRYSGCNLLFFESLNRGRGYVHVTASITRRIKTGHRIDDLAALIADGEAVSQNCKIRGPCSRGHGEGRKQKGEFETVCHNSNCDVVFRLLPTFRSAPARGRRQYHFDRLVR